MLETGAATQVTGKVTLQREIACLIDNPDQIESRNKAAMNFSKSAENVIDKTVNLIWKYV
jgi:3-deoxy-D-manno-octulosonic-acid transferase